jgi:hypothetical protein
MGHDMPVVPALRERLDPLHPIGPRQGKGGQGFLLDVAVVKREVRCRGVPTDFRFGEDEEGPGRQGVDGSFCSPDSQIDAFLNEAVTFFLQSPFFEYRTGVSASVVENRKPSGLLAVPATPCPVGIAVRGPTTDP